MDGWISHCIFYNATQNCGVVRCVAMREITRYSRPSYITRCYVWPAAFQFSHTWISFHS